MTDIARTLSVPTLVLHSRNDARVRFEEGRRTASLIPGARLIALEGGSHILQEGEAALDQFLDEVFAFLAVPTDPVRASHAAVTALTRRERDVLELIARGTDNRAIAEQLFLSSSTVRNHITRIFAKLGVRNRAEAIVHARRTGFGHGRESRTPGPASLNRRRFSFPGIRRVGSVLPCCGDGLAAYWAGAAAHAAVHSSPQPEGIMRYTLFVAVCMLGAVPHASVAQQPAASNEKLIANALSAAPLSIAAAAQVMLMDGTLLRPGTNGWTCFPDDASVPNDSPMCLDAPWLAFFDAYMHRRTPSIKGVGIAYMLQSDMPVSNIDPFATGPTPDNQWLQEGVPHIMVLVADATLPEALTADPHNGGPWVMWKGTPYAHIMIPTVPRVK